MYFSFRMVKQNRINADSEAVTNIYRFLWRQSHEVIHGLSVWLKLHKQTGSLRSDWLQLPSVTLQFTSLCRAHVSYWPRALSAPTYSPLTGQTTTLPNKVKEISQSFYVCSKHNQSEPTETDSIRNIIPILSFRGQKHPFTAAA